MLVGVFVRFINAHYYGRKQIESVSLMASTIVSTKVKVN